MNLHPTKPITVYLDLQVHGGKTTVQSKAITLASQEWENQIPPPPPPPPKPIMSPFSHVFFFGGLLIFSSLWSIGIHPAKSDSLKLQL